MPGTAPRSYAPMIEELPASPSGKVGWPWTVGTAAADIKQYSYVSTYPRVTVVTPSFNHADFIEETIRSVLLQGYPNLEYFVIDGGSTDGTVDIIRRYAPWLAGWVSEPDAGQSHAINKGWRRATGSIVAYLNSDDVYQPGAMHAAVCALLHDPTVGMVHGDSYFVDAQGVPIRKHRGCDLTVRQLLRWQGYISQPTVFLRKEVLENVGVLSESLHYAMDFELWLRIGIRYPMKHLPRMVASERHHASAKTVLSPEKGLAAQVVAADGVFAGSVPPDIYAMRSEVLATHYLNLARFLLGKAGRAAEVQQHATAALQLEPPWPLRVKGWGVWLAARPLATPLGSWLRAVKRVVAGWQHRRSLADDES